MIDRRTLLTAAAAVPFAGVGATAVHATTKDQLMDLIAELESPPDYEMGIVHYTKAWAASRIREILGEDVPESQNLTESHLLHDHFKAASEVWQRTYGVAAGA